METNARPETLLPATLVCTKKPTGKNNNGHYEITIPLIYLVEAFKKPAAFYKFLFVGLRYKEDKCNTKKPKAKNTANR
jgi:hypothetical protein